MFDFMKPKVALPANFLRTAFQAGTGLYKTDNRLPTKEFCAAYLAAIATEDTFPSHSSALMAIDTKEELQAGYFQNETGGIIIYCHYDNPAFLDLNRRSSVIVVGNLKPERLSEKEDDYSFETYFAFLGHHHQEYLLPVTINTFYDYDEKNPETVLSLNIDTKSEISLAMAFYFADLCFKSVLANKPTSPKEAYKKADTDNPENLISHFEQLKTRGLGTLESEVKIANNVSLKDHTVKPTI